MENSSSSSHSSSAKPMQLQDAQNALRQCVKMHPTCEMRATVSGGATVDIDSFLAMSPHGTALPEFMQLGMDLQVSNVPACKELLACATEMVRAAPASQPRQPRP